MAIKYPCLQHAIVQVSENVPSNISHLNDLNQIMVTWYILYPIHCRNRRILVLLCFLSILFRLSTLSCVLVVTVSWFTRKWTRVVERTSGSYV